MNQATGKVGILDIRVDTTSYSAASASVAKWAQRNESRYVCAANVHMVMEAYDSPDFKDIVNAADLVTPDGMPLVWMLRRQGYSNQQRVYGPDLMLEIIAHAAETRIPLGFYGSTPTVLKEMLYNLKMRFPSMKTAYRYSPPFRPLTSAEDHTLVESINSTGARILFVGLGCPKQERWMAEHKGKIHAVMIGVGAAFDFYAGHKRQAPKWMQGLGLEWFFRLTQEPTRLWKRYLYQNPRFLILALWQIFMER